MAPSTDDLARQIQALPCGNHSRALHRLAVVQDEQMLLLKSVSEDLRYLREEIQVNGSKGLQAVLYDNYQATMRLMDVTRGLRANSKLKEALREWTAEHPIVGKLFGGFLKKVLWLIVVAVLGYLGITL